MTISFDFTGAQTWIIEKQVCFGYNRLKLTQ